MRRRRTPRSRASTRRAWLSQPSGGQRTTVLGRIQHYPRPPRRALRDARLRGPPDSAGHDLRAAMGVMGRGGLGFPLSPVQVEPQGAENLREIDVSGLTGFRAFIEGPRSPDSGSRRREGRNFGRRGFGDVRCGTLARPLCRGSVRPKMRTETVCYTPRAAQMRSS